MSNNVSIIENIEALQAALPNLVALVAVTKTKPIADIQMAYDYGLRDFGENKVQEMLAKHEALPKDIRWHMIGHLQRNKVQSIVGKTHLIHGIDSIRLLNEINKRAEGKGIVVDGLLQVHIADEETKFGFDIEEIRSLLNGEILSKTKGVRIKGLMGMASFSSDNEKILQEFSQLNELYTEIKENHPELEFDTLSMGMSGDYSFAIAAGSNMIRIGSAIFGKR